MEVGDKFIIIRGNDAYFKKKCKKFGKTFEITRISKSQGSAYYNDLATNKCNCRYCYRPTQYKYDYIKKTREPLPESIERSISIFEVKVVTPRLQHIRETQLRRLFGKEKPIQDETNEY